MKDLCEENNPQNLRVKCRSLRTLCWSLGITRNRFAMEIAA